MRFKFEGRWDIQTLAETIQQQLTSVCDQYGIKSVSAVNLYFHMYDAEGNQIEIEGPNQEAIAGMLFRNPNPPKRVKKKKAAPGTVVPFQQKHSTTP